MKMGGGFHFAATRMVSSGIELFPNSFRDEDLTEEVFEQVESTDGCEVGDRGGVGDDHHSI